MPRIENWGPNVAEWCEATGHGSTTVDVCRSCYRIIERDPHAYDEELAPALNYYAVGEPQGSEGWAGDVAHPPYDDGPYRCEVCDDPLTDGEDG